MSWTPPYPSYGADRRGRYFATSQYEDETANFGRTRGFGRLWDADADGQIKGDPGIAGWSRGELIRSGQPVFVLTSLGPVHDPTDLSTYPQMWRPNL